MVHFYSEKQCRSLVNKRAGEVKLGEVITVVENFERLPKLAANYILIGIPEDIGVRANLGKPGASKAWREALQSFCNIQKNDFIQAENIAILGTIDCDFNMEQAAKIRQEDPHLAEKLGELVTQVDHKVATVISKIVSAGKTPIVVGGGHNNSYGNLKGTSTAIGKPLHCINMDAHTDFRALEHRHSGNGFSYAKEDGYLDRYFVLGLHRNYTSDAIFKNMKEHSATVKFSFFEDRFASENENFITELEQAAAFCGQGPFGIELDMDSIANMGSSAMTPSGYTVEEARYFLKYYAKNQNCQYIHICEGSPEAALFPNQVGKTISYFISDIISA